MKKKLSVLLIVMMAFVAIFALTACDPEIIEKLPEQVLAEMFAQLGDNYVVDVDVSIGEDDEVLQKAKISYEGKKVKYELTLFEPETRYFDIESDGTAYMYVEEPDYGWVKEEIDVGYYNEMVDRFYIERNGLDDASKYTFTVNGTDVKYQLKAEYLPEGVTAVSVWIASDGRLVMTIVDGQGDAAMKLVGYFGSFGSVKVTFPELADENNQAEEKIEELNNYFISYRNRNTTIEWTFNGNFYKLMARVEGDHELYMLYSETKVSSYDPETGEFTDMFMKQTDYFDFDRNTEEWTNLYIRNDGEIVSNKVEGSLFHDLLKSRGYLIWSYVMDGSFYNYNADENSFELNENMANAAYEAYYIVNCKAYLSPRGSNPELRIIMEIADDTYSMEIEVKIYDMGKTEFDFPVVA